MKKIKKQLRNSFWILTEKASKIGLYFVIGILLARYLGPNDFGIYNVVISVLKIGSGLAAVGLNGILIKEYVTNDNVYKVVISGLVARLIGIFIAISVSLFILWYWFAEYLGAPLVLLVSFAISFSLVQIADLYFESRLESSISAKYRVTGYLLGGGVKLYLIINGFGYKYLLVSSLLELFIIFLLGYITLLIKLNFFYFYKELKHIDFKYVRVLLKKGFPLLISGIAVLLYMKIDQFFIFNYLDPKSVGLYSSATRLCEGLFIFSAIIVPSFFPQLIEHNNKNNIIEYKKLLKKLVGYLFMIGLFLAIITFFLSEEITLFLYGSSYIKSADVLGIYALSIPIVYVGDVLSRWLIIENLVKYSIVRHFLGFIVNIILNVLLIPIYGIEGAAIASVSAYLSSIFIFVIIVPRARVFLITIFK